jgi:S-adenosylhomocysteine hydrolase
MNFTEESIKMSIISLITMLQDNINAPYAKFTFDELYGCDYSNLETIRDTMFNAYNAERKG